MNRSGVWKFGQNDGEFLSYILTKGSCYGLRHRGGGERGEGGISWVSIRLYASYYAVLSQALYHS